MFAGWEYIERKCSGHERRCMMNHHIPHLAPEPMPDHFEDHLHKENEAKKVIQDFQHQSQELRLVIMLDSHR